VPGEQQRWATGAKSGEPRPLADCLLEEIGARARNDASLRHLPLSPTNPSPVCLSSTLSSEARGRDNSPHSTVCRVVPAPHLLCTHSHTHSHSRTHTHTHTHTHTYTRTHPRSPTVGARLQWSTVVRPVDAASDAAHAPTPAPLLSQ
jgi:ABC-type nickel/cobalt efflux system permease component RcnA